METSFQNALSYAAPYLIPPAAASAAIIPVFYGFIVKSSQQLGEPVPKMGARAVLAQGVKASPVIGGIVGVQFIAQIYAEKFIEKVCSGKSAMIGSSLLVGLASAPALAVFNGLTMGRKISESLKALTPKQTGAIVIREASFLFSLRISGPLAEALRSTCGDNKTTAYGCAFFSGVTGSIVGHLPDTALTRLQKGLQIESVRQLARGMPVKAAAVGTFSVLYKFCSEKFFEFSN